MAEPFFRETRVVQLRTVFGNAPCLKLSVDGYIKKSRQSGIFGGVLKCSVKDV